MPWEVCLEEWERYDEALVYWAQSQQLDPPWTTEQFCRLLDVLDWNVSGAGAAFDALFPSGVVEPTAEPTATAIPRDVVVYETCDDALAAEVPSDQNADGTQVGFLPSLVPNAEDTDGDGIVCDMDAEDESQPRPGTDPEPEPEPTVYASCQAAQDAGERRERSSIDDGRGFPQELVPSEIDFDGDGLVCKVYPPPPTFTPTATAVPPPPGAIAPPSWGSKFRGFTRSVTEWQGNGMSLCSNWLTGNNGGPGSNRWHHCWFVIRFNINVPDGWAYGQLGTGDQPKYNVGFACVQRGGSGHVINHDIYQDGSATVNPHNRRLWWAQFIKGDKLGLAKPDIPPNREDIADHMTNTVVEDFADTERLGTYDCSASISWWYPNGSYGSTRSDDGTFDHTFPIEIQA